MGTASGRAKTFKQPFGGFVKPSSFECIHYEDGKTLNPEENINPTITGTVVDYMSRRYYVDPEEAFRIPLKGAYFAEERYGVKNAIIKARSLFLKILTTDHDSIVNACKLVTFDDWVRSPSHANINYCDILSPDEATTENIRLMLRRSFKFFQKYGPAIAFGFNFGPEEDDDSAYERFLRTKNGVYGGYTAIIDSGDGDFLSPDTLWDFKVSKYKPDSKQTLQLLIYYLMGKHSGQEKFKNITKIGIFNPRLNDVYLLNVSDIPGETIRTVEQEVIGY